MKKLWLIFLILMGAALLSPTANAGLFCRLVKIENHQGSCYVDGYAPIQNTKTHKYGLAKKGNHIIIPAQYDNSAGIDNGLWAVELNSKWGMVTVNNDIIIPFEYDKLNPPNQHGIIRANKNGQWGFIDKNQNELLVFGKYDYVEPFAFDGFAWVRKDDKWGFIDKDFNEIAPPQYDTHNYFTRPIVCIKKNGKSGCINKQGVEVVPFIYDKIDVYGSQTQSTVVAYLNDEVFYFDNLRIKKVVQ
ncbi:WG repeat-containing protein [Moraxella oblonga]|uniref:WG repeat-containing protein n=1 Tax=Moraxella oblonga TaxID=200413 RepID=UPI000830A961|nr:WG repeat-containing protein [Moraxella oblonga]